MSTFGKLSTCAAWLIFAAAAAFAQSAPAVATGTFEVGGFVGSSYGIDDFRVMGGGNVCYGVTKHILPYAEYSYFPGIGREINGTFPNTGRPYTIRYSIPLQDFHGGVHIRIPIKESKVVPYLVIGLGGVSTPARTVEGTFEDVSGTRPLSQSVPSSNSFAVNFGGGLRYYTNQRFGLRVEAKAYKPTGTFSDYFGKVEAGFFFQFR